MNAFLVGLAVALGVWQFALRVGLDRDRAFYPTVLVVVASYYVLFAVMGGSTRALLIELAIAAVFIAMVVAGFRRNLWIVAAGLFAHGVMDLFHPGLVDNPGVPGWWPGFCLGYDVGAAILLGLMLWRGLRPARPAAGLSLRP